MTDPDAGALAAAVVEAAEAVADVEPTAEAEPTGRPTFTVTAAAKATGVSRRSIGRLLDAGDLPDATRDAAGTWSIPAEALLSAGLTLHAPTPPDPAPAAELSRVGQSPPASSTADALADPDQLRAEIAALRAELAELPEWRRRAQVAEAVSTVQADALADLRAALALAQRMLPAGSAVPATDFPDREATGSAGPATDFPDRVATAPTAPPAAVSPTPSTTGRLARLWRKRRP